MQFTDIIFPIFLTLVFICYWFVAGKSTRWQNILLLSASYVFYGWWEWRFLGLIMLTTVATYLSAFFSQGTRGKLVAGCNIALNLGILIAFKYFNFFSEGLARLAGLFGISLDWFTIEVLLPVGISFYTFQAISYSVDVCRREVAPCRDFVSFATFIAYFPQLVAGPIERASQLLPQIQNPRNWNSSYATSGLRMILFGVMKKVCVADMLAIYVDRLFEAGMSSPLHVVAAGVLFSLEIYCDFSAYSEIARGVSRLLGIELMANFKFPYFSRNVLEFWRRWHISLMLWFRNYIYIPLGGNRKGNFRTALNITLVFLLSGLWHGAAMNFVLWGAYWAIAFCIARFVLGQKRRDSPISFSDLPDMLATFGVVSFGFYIFRSRGWTEVAQGLESAGWYFALFAALWLAARLIVARRWILALASAGAVAAACAFVATASCGWIMLLKMWWLIAATMVLIVEWRNRNAAYPMQLQPRSRMARFAVYWVFIIMVILSEPADMTFIYFQF